MKKFGIFFILIALVLSLNVIVDIAFRGARVDLTEDSLYSLSDGTKQVLADLKSPLKIHFYFSDKAATGLPAIKDYGKRVEDLLKEYVALSGGKISLSVTDPEPFSEEEDEAVAYGLRGAQTVSGEKLYFGLVISDEADGQEVIPFFAQEREALVEYDLTQNIDRLNKGAVRPKLAVITTLPMQFGPGGIQALQQGVPPQPYAIYEQLRQTFEVQLLGLEFEELDDDIDVLLIAQAPGLGETQRYLIDQYVLGGGKAIVFVDPYSEASAVANQVTQLGAPQAPSSFNMPDLLASWGMRLESGKVVGDLAQAQRVNMGAGADPRRQVVDFIPWLGVNEYHMAADDIVTGQLAQLNMASAGALMPMEGRTTTIEPLVTSSEDAGLLDVFEVEGQPDPDRLIRTLQPTGETYILGARISGPANTAFPDKEGEGHIAQAQDINVLIMSDTDMLEDRFWAQVQDFFGQRVIVPIADNGRFVVNAVDNMTGSDALISLRSRAVSARPFTVIERIRREAEARYLNEEQLLEDKLQAAEQRIAQLEGEGDGGEAFL
ncbi:MAG: Gldg family protein, partial [Sphingomonadales bacterium]